MCHIVVTLIGTLDVAVVIVAVVSEDGLRQTNSRRPCLLFVQERMDLLSTSIFLAEVRMVSYVPSFSLQDVCPVIARIYGFDFKIAEASQMLEEAVAIVPNMVDAKVVGCLFRSFVFVSVRFRHAGIRTYFLACCSLDVGRLVNVTLLESYEEEDIIIFLVVS